MLVCGSGLCHVANMNAMSAPDADSHTRLSSANPADPQVVKPLPGYVYTLFLLFCVVPPACAFIGFLARDHWGQWAFHLSQARVIVAAIAVLAFLPIVWSAFSRFIVDLVRRIKPLTSGKHATEAHPAPCS